MMRGKQLPNHWANKGDTMFLRADGVIVEVALEGSASGKPDEERQIGWRVRLPIYPLPNGEHFLGASQFSTVGALLRKVDQEWPPSAHILATIPGDWLGHDLERLAREASS